MASISGRKANGIGLFNYNILFICILFVPGTIYDIDKLLDHGCPSACESDGRS